MLASFFLSWSFILPLLAEPLCQCSQLNVQIVNNTAITSFCRLHVCLEEQQSLKASKGRQKESEPCAGVASATAVLLQMALILASLELSFHISFVFFFFY